MYVDDEGNLSISSHRLALCIDDSSMNELPSVVIYLLQREELPSLPRVKKALALH